MDRQSKNSEIRERRRNHVSIFVIMFCLCAIAIGSIFLSAYASEVQYDINTMNKEIQDSQRRIQNLEAKIKSLTNVTALEARAFELGMDYPALGTIKHLDGEPEVQDLALALMETAYGK